MLDLYRVGELGRWPDDVPEGAVLLGSVDIDELHRWRDLIAPCFAPVGVDVTSFADWYVGPADLDLVLPCLEATAADNSAVRRFVDLVRQAKGATLLAVCD